MCQDSSLLCQVLIFSIIEESEVEENFDNLHVCCSSRYGTGVGETIATDGTAAATFVGAIVVYFFFVLWIVVGGNASEGQLVVMDGVKCVGIGKATILFAFCFFP